MSGQNEVLPKNLEANVQSQDWTYNPKCSRERCFGQPSDSSYFLLWSCFSKNMANRRFFTYLENLDHLKYSKTLYDLGEF
jgi:hypothetical protein